VLTGGAGKRAMTRAFEDVFGVRDGLAGLSIAGRTDPWIIAQVAAAHAIPYDDNTAARFRGRYVEHLQNEIRKPGDRKGIMPGVGRLLDHLRRRNDAYLALLTGNVSEGARIKLEYFGLWDYFRWGGFGEDGPERNDLFQTVVARVAQGGGPLIPPAAAVVVGDTPYDIGVARAGGTRSLGVATGSFDVSALEAAGADTVLPDLSDLIAVLPAMGLR
jgi:phosphoglycolate phosphatase-like HAD superfamily hydrolase